MSADLQPRLFDSLLEAASDKAEKALDEHDGDTPALGQVISDLELSPLVDKQLIAAALRLATELCLSGGVRQSLLNRFHSPAPTVAIEGQRRVIERDVKESGLPMELASDYAATLERRIAVPAHELPDVLWSYASIYDDLWSDPRIGARSPTRRIMLAMVTVLRARSAQLVAAKIPKRTAPPTAMNYGRESAVPTQPIGIPWLDRRAVSGQDPS
jgi:hypothetical protein